MLQGKGRNPLAQATQTVKKAVDPEVARKLGEGYRFVKIPATDIYDVPFDGLWINRDHYAPGTHLLSQERADEIEFRLARWQDEMIRLLRPSSAAGRRSQEQANRRGMAIVANPEDMQ